MTQGDSFTVQGDPTGCFLSLVDINTKVVLFQYSSNLMQKFWIVESTPGVYSKLVSTNH